MNKTTIEWCRTYKPDGTFEEGHTVNPIRYRPHGSTRTTTMCQKVSPGCKNCYAEAITRRFWPKDADSKFPGYTAPGLATGEFVLDENQLLSILKHKKPTRIFWGDMTDLFQPAIPDSFLDKCSAVVALTPHITHMFLTKRPERAQPYYSDKYLFQRIHEAVKAILGYHNPKRPAINPSDLPLPNFQLGVSVENQDAADKRIPLLLQTPAAVRFISAEPLLGLVDLTRIDLGASCWEDSLNGKFRCYHAMGGMLTRDSRRGRIHWVIIGGESGPGARPCNTIWIREIVLQCQAAGVPCFVKQLGAHVIQNGERRIKRDTKGGDMHEWPHEIRVREFPTVSREAAHV